MVELAEFYQIEGYQYWRQAHQPDTLFGAAAVGDDDESDESESNEAYSTLTRAEAVRQFPEAAHQTLAAVLGLVYTKIRKEVGEGRLPPRAPKRNQEEVISNTSSSRQQKSVKLARGPHQAAFWRPTKACRPWTIFRTKVPNLRRFRQAGMGCAFGFSR